MLSTLDYLSGGRVVLTIHGPPGRCVEQAQKLLDAGVRTLVFSTVTHDRIQLERLGQEVLPELERMSNG